MIIKEINKSYGQQKVLKGINLSMDKTGLIFIVGNSGSGKSTLLHIMGLLDKEYEGEIILDNEKVQHNNKFIGKYMDFVFQDFNLISMLSVKENIKLASQVMGVDSEVDVDELCENLGLEKCKDRKANTLSGGEKQRVAIARALVRKNPILFADEPTGNLDTENEKNIFDILKEISKKKLVVVITHNVEAANEYGDRIIKIQDGRIIEDMDKGYQDNQKVIFKDEKTADKKQIRKTMISLSIKSLISRRKKIIPSCIVSILCMITMAISFGAYNAGSKSVDVINNNIFESDKKIIEKRDFDIGYTIIEEDFVSKLSKIEGIKEINPELSSDLRIQTSEIVTDGYYNIKTETVKNTEFYKERYVLSQGRLPKKNNEVVINENLAKKYFEETNVVGKKINISTSNKKVELTVVGVEGDNVTKTNRVIVIDKFWEELYTEGVVGSEWRISLPQYDYVGYRINKKRTLSDVMQDEWYTLVYGEEPKETNEILIDISGVNQILQMMEYDVIYSNQDLANGSLSEEHKKAVLGLIMNYVSDTDSIVSEMKVVGICTSDTSFNNIYDIEEAIPIYINEEYVEEIKNKKFVNRIKIYTEDEDALKQIKSLCDEYGLELNNANEMYSTSIKMRLSSITTIMIILCVVITIITVFMLRYSTKMNILDSIYEMGVIKSLGATNLFVFGKFICESAIQGTIAGLITVIIGVVAASSNVLTYEEINLIDFEIYFWGILVIAGIIISVLSGLSEIRKISKKQIVECLKRN